MSADAPELRRIDPERDDMATLLDLILASFASMNGVIDPPSSALRLTSQSLREKAAHETGYAIFDRGKPVACMFCDDRGDVLYVGKLAVDPMRQGEGLGRRLLAEAEKLAGTLGRRELELQTRVELTGNHAFFGRQGFVKTGEGAHAGYPSPTWIVMRKPLGGPA